MRESSDRYGLQPVEGSKTEYVQCLTLQVPNHKARWQLTLQISDVQAAVGDESYSMPAPLPQARYEKVHI